MRRWFEMLPDNSSLSPVFRGEGRGEGFFGTSKVSRQAEEPLTPNPSPLSTGARGTGARWTPKSLSLVFAFLAAISAVHLSPARAADPPLYANDFEKAAEGELAKDLVVLSGAFTVTTVDGNKLLELPGDPVDNFGVLFGPEGQSTLSVRASVYATSTGKRNPEFGVGLGDSNGYKLWLMPATGQLQIIKGEEVVAHVAYADWKSGSWTTLRLQVRVANGKPVVEGRAWPKGQPEPATWAVTFTDNADAPKGRASIWGAPFSSTPIRFDDLEVSKAVGP